jgi:hypothetical protein
MRDIVKRLRNAAEYDVGFGPLLREAAEAADEIERLTKELAELRKATCHSWKAVTERLPDEGQEVLVVSPCPNGFTPNIDIASWGEEGQQGPVWRESDCARVHPTHWMPLPQSPAVEGEP